MKKIILLLLFFVSTFSIAQNKKEIDSLKKIISSNITDDEKADAYHNLLQIIINTNVEESKKYIQELYKLNKNNSCEKCEALADLNQGFYYYTKVEDDKAIIYYQKSASKSLKINDFENYEVAKLQLIQTYINSNNLEKGELELNNLLKFKKEKKLTKNTEQIYFLLGQSNILKGFNKTAIENLLLADNTIINNKSKNNSLRIEINNMIVTLYTNLKSFDKAREYNDKALVLAEKTKNEEAIMNVILYRGFLETAAKNYEVAKNNLLKAHNYYSKVNNNMYSNVSALFLGKVFFHLNDNSKSLNYTNSAIESFSKNNQNNEYARALVNRARVNIVKNNIQIAKTDIDLAKSLLKENINSGSYLEVLDVEIEYFKKTKNTQNAIKTISFKDSIKQVLDSKTNQNSLNEVEAKYQNEKKEQQIKLLSTQNELAKKQKYIYIGLLGLLALIGVSLFYGYRNKIKTAQKLNELNELKSRFFANISHEFRTPLTLIKSPVQSLQSEITDENQKNKLQLIDANSTRMLELVDQLLQLSKIDSGNLKLILKDGNIGYFLNSIIEPFEFEAKDKGLNFISTIQKNTVNHLFDKDVIEKIVTNLVSNAFKYSKKKETIIFNSLEENSNLKLIVSNTGSDLKKEDLQKLFERFYQKNESQQGIGIGLALVKELVDLYKGTIETTLENDKLSFIVQLPLSISNENAVIIPSKSDATIIENLVNNESELPLLLLVDDNSEIRNILKDIFKNDYKIVEAQDGEIALKLAQKEIPDCIISDVMMPKMDGFEFTKNIKSNELTSFIPVILLTAKTSDEAHLEGLKSTTDAFLTKPFNNEIVKATVHQLISERKKLHQRYSQELILRPVDIVINSQEEKFIQKLQVILDKNISNSEFSSEDFASEIGMSRMQLHRKLKSLLGVTSTEFLRNERLKVAAELLKKGNGNISEIAYSVGFNDVSYFSKCFKEMYHCTPTEYIENK